MSTILAIDDIQDNLTSLEAIFGQHLTDCRLLTALEGKTGIEMALTEQPDTVLLDLRMPRMDGFEVCRVLKHDPRTKNIPVIILTAQKSGSQDLVRALENGADSFLSKPVEPAELAAQVKVALRIKHSEDQLRERQVDLEHLIKERTRDLVKTNNELRKENVNRLEVESELRQSEMKLRSLSLHLQEIRDQEQARIARELHDELGQLLTGIKMELSILKQKIPKDPDMAEELINSLFKHADMALDSVREISGKLRTEVIQNLGFVPAIHDLVSKFEKVYGIKVQSDIPDKLMLQDSLRASSIFRIIQESFTNIAKHAEATLVEIGIISENGMLHIQIKDNGLGIPSDRLHNDDSFGILGMNERARSLKGTLKIQRQEDKGTRVSLVVPLE